MIEIKTYRGHIRNWQALSQELNLDCTGMTRQEREIAILQKAYATWKENMAEHLYGMFAFALWDDAEQKLICFRDHFGTKPFYYYLTEDNKILYGTYIKEILDKSGFKKELNLDMLQIYMSLTYVAGEDTFFKGIKKLMPGHYVRMKLNLWKNLQMKFMKLSSKCF